MLDGDQGEKREGYSAGAREGARREVSLVYRSMFDRIEAEQASMLHRGEGLVIKNPDSKYILAGRDSTWIKVKPGELVLPDLISLHDV